MLTAVYLKINAKYRYTNYIKNAKYNYDREVVKKNCSNPRDIWRTINSKLGKNTKTSVSITQIIDTNNQNTKKREPY